MLPGERTNGNSCNCFSDYAPEWWGHWCQMGSWKQSSLWDTHSQTGNFAKQKCQKRSFDRGWIHLCSCEDLTLVFVTAAQCGVIRIMVWSDVWHTRHSCGYHVLVRQVCTWDMAASQDTWNQKSFFSTDYHKNPTAVCIRPPLPCCFWTPTVDWTHRGIM